MGGRKHAPVGFRGKRLALGLVICFSWTLGYCWYWTTDDESRVAHREDADLPADAFGASIVPAGTHNASTVVSTSNSTGGPPVSVVSFPSDGGGSDGDDEQNNANRTTTAVTTNGDDVWGTHPVWNYPVAPSSSRNQTRAARAIGLLSMGQAAAASALLERCVLSVRKKGGFVDQPIVVLTDAPLARYRNLTDHDPFLVVLNPLERDWVWELKRDLPYKRFKTFFLEYLDRDPRLASVQFVYYLDVDVVVGQPLAEWFRFVESHYRHGVLGGPESQIAFFEGNVSPLQGGQFFLQRNHSQACLELWRYYMDSTPQVHKDQFSLTRMWDDQQEREGLAQPGQRAKKFRKLPKAKAGDGRPSQPCRLSRIPQLPYLEFLTPKDMSVWKHGDAATSKQAAKRPPPYPTLMHIKNTQHAQDIPHELQESFLEHLFEEPVSWLRAHNLSGPTVAKRIRPNRTWSALQVRANEQTAN